jgi:hypothetical protein
MIAFEVQRELQTKGTPIADLERLREVATGEGFEEMMRKLEAAMKNVEDGEFTEERKEVMRKRFAGVAANLKKHREEVEEHLQRHEVEGPKRLKAVKLLDKEARRRMKHEENGHLPFDPTCRGCIQGAGRERQHRRNKNPKHGALYVDTAGRFSGGVDVDGENRKYFFAFAYRGLESFRV